MELIDLDSLNSGIMRATVGAVNVACGEMCYFDSRKMKLDLRHILASGALPPAFPAIEIDGQFYWDGGVYSNTPVEAVFDDIPRHDSTIFVVDLWQSHGALPRTLWEVMSRQKDIQYSSRELSHIVRQQQIHRLRHVIGELVNHLDGTGHDDPRIAELASYGCKTTMKLIRLIVPRLAREDHTKDIDFSLSGIAARWEAGRKCIGQVTDKKPWEQEVDPLAGVLLYEAN